MARVSIVIPVYNVAKYIRKCLESIRQQSYKDYEVLLVDDGSTDGSGSECDWYAWMDKRFRCIHRKNGGVSAARNSGIDAAGGEWISFIDPDDWVDMDYFQRMIEAQESINADIVEGITRVASESGIKGMMLDEPIRTIKGKRDIATALADGMISTAIWGKLYRMEIWQDKRFPMGFDMGEDYAIIADICLAAEKIMHTPAAIYNYRIRNNSLSHGSGLQNYRDALRGFNIFQKAVEQQIGRREEDEAFEAFWSGMVIMQASGQRGRGKGSRLLNLVEMVPDIKESTENKYLNGIVDMLVSMTGRG